MAYDGSLKFDTHIDTSGFASGLKSLGGIAKTGLNGAITAIGAIGGALSTAAGFAIKTGIEFESAFAGVKKTVDATDAEFVKLRQGILDMSKEIPMAASDIAGIAESAGQLGIQNDNILGFTRVMADLGVATNLTGEEAASTLAKFANITGMDQSNFDRLGSTIVALGNNLATTEADIAAMAMRLAGAGKQVGLTEAEIMSFAGALSSVGIEAEAGGTAFSKVFSDMQLAVETGNGDLQNFAKVAGMSAKEFAGAFKDDAAGAMTTFIQGLGQSEEKGMSAIKVLDDMGITEIRMRDALLRAAGASDVFTGALDLGTKAWEENTAMTNEANQRYTTMESRIQMLKNGVAELGIAFYESTNSEIGEAVTLLNGYVGTLTTAFQAGGLEGLVSALGGVLSDVVSKVADFAPKLVDMSVSLIQSFVTGITSNLSQISQSASAIMTSLFNGIRELLPQLMPIIAEFGAKFVEGFIQYQNLFYTAAVQIITSLVQGIANNLPTLIPMLQTGLVMLANTLIQNLPLFINAAMQIIASLAQGIAYTLPTLIPAIIDCVMIIVQTLVDNLPLLLDAGLQLLMGLAQGIIQAIPTLVAALPGIINSLVTFLVDAIPQIIDAWITLLLSLVDALPEIINAIVKALPQIIDGIVSGLLSALPQIIQAGIDLLVALIGALPEIITTIVAALPQIIGGILNGLLGALPQLIMAGVQLFVALIQNLPTIIVEICKAAPLIIQGLVQAFGSMLSMMWDVGKNLLEGIWQGISNAAGWLWDKVKEWAGGLLDNIKGLFGIKSPSRVMRDEVGAMIVKGLAIGIEGSAHLAIEAMEAMSEGLLESERAYLAEKERLESEQAKEDEEKRQKEYDEKLKNAKSEAEREKIRQEELLRIKKEADKKYLDQLKATAEAEKKELEKVKDDIRSIYEDIADYADKHIGDVIKSQEKLEDKLKNFGQLTETITFKGAGREGEDVVNTVLHNQARDIEALNDYKKALLAAKERMREAGFDSETIKNFFQQMADMSVEEGTEFAKLLTSASDDEFKEYVTYWDIKIKFSEQIAEELYSDEFREAVDNTKDYMTEQLTEAGLEVPEEFFTSGTLSAQNFGTAFIEELDKQMAKVRALIDTFNMSLVPQVSVAGAGASAAGNYTNNSNNSTTYVLSGSGETVSQQLQSAKAHSEVERMRNG